MQGDNNKQGRLSRWSKRKLAARHHEPDLDEANAEPTTDAGEQARIAAERAANRDAAEAVDLDALNEDSDYSVFLKDGVPDLLKKQAMAVLWRSNPVFANVDGLVDYDDDFGSPDLLMKTFKSAYEAGRGYLEHQQREARVAAADGDADASAEVVSSPQAEENEEVVAEENQFAQSGQESSSAATEEPADAEAPVTESIEPEAVRTPAPKVSLRKRLQLETKG